MKKSPRLKYVSSDAGIPESSPIDLYSYFPYEEEWWVNVYTKIYGTPQIEKSEWVVELEIDVEKLYDFNIELKKIAIIIDENNFFGNVSCIVSPNNIGRIDIYMDYSNILPAVEKVGLSIGDQVSLKTPDNINFYYARDVVCKKITNLKVCGIEKITRIFPKEIVNGSHREWVIDTQGCNFKSILNFKECDFTQTTCDDFWQVYHVLGIEAVRNVLISEFTKSLSFDGSYINPRHIELLVDAMTSSGIITSVRREGIDRSVGPLAKCAFEKTLDNFGIAAMFCEKEDVSGVSASITLGKLAKIGTGVSEVLPDPTYVSRSIHDTIEKPRMKKKKTEREELIESIVANY